MAKIRSQGSAQPVSDKPSGAAVKGKKTKGPPKKQVTSSKKPGKVTKSTSKPKMEPAVQPIPKYTPSAPIYGLGTLSEEQQRELMKNLPKAIDLAHLSRRTKADLLKLTKHKLSPGREFGVMLKSTEKEYRALIDGSKPNMRTGIAKMAQYYEAALKLIQNDMRKHNFTIAAISDDLYRPIGALHKIYRPEDFRIIACGPFVKCDSDV